MSDLLEIIMCIAMLIVGIVLAVVLGLTITWEIVRGRIDSRGRKTEWENHPPPPKIF